MINIIKKVLVKDLRSKENSHIHGKPLEKYVPGEPLKKRPRGIDGIEIQEKNPSVWAYILESLVYIVFFSAGISVTVAAMKYLFSK